MMLIKAENGNAYNLAHLSQLRIVERSKESDIDDDIATEAESLDEAGHVGSFGIEAITVSYYSKERGFFGGPVTLAHFTTREEAEKAIDMIVTRSGGCAVKPLSRNWEVA